MGSPIFGLLFIFSLAFSGLAILTSHQGLALKILNLSFLLLIVGVIIYLKELKKGG